MVAVLDRISLLRFSFPITGCNPPQGGVSPLAEEGRTLIDLAVPLYKECEGLPAALKPMPARTTGKYMPWEPGQVPGFKLGAGIEGHKSG